MKSKITPLFILSIPFIVTIAFASSSGWKVYKNEKFHFSFKYPPAGKLKVNSSRGVEVTVNLSPVQKNLPRAEKTYTIAVGPIQNSECVSGDKSKPEQSPSAETLTISGVPFTKIEDNLGSTNNNGQLVKYLAKHGEQCVSLSLTVRSARTLYEKDGGEAPSLDPEFEILPQLLNEFSFSK